MDILKILKPSTWKRNLPEPIPEPEPFTPGSDDQSMKLYSRIQHHCQSSISPSRYLVFKDQPFEVFLANQRASWETHWYGRPVSDEEYAYVWSGRFAKDQEALKDKENK